MASQLLLCCVLFWCYALNNFFARATLSREIYEEPNMTNIVRERESSGR